VSLNPTLSYTVTVGAGGSNNTNGANSTFSGYATSAVGGGKGGYDSIAAGSGGSGGGGGGTSGAIGTATSGQGNNGGTGSTSGNWAGGGGGGAGAVGGSTGTGTGAGGGTGGAGTASSISGASVTYAGGGGGSSYDGAVGAGGSSIGGSGAKFTPAVNPTSATASTGSGGGGSTGTVTAGFGGSGIVIISYVGAQQFSGGVVTSSGGNTIHTFTTSGTLGPITTLSASYLVVAGGGGGGSGGGGGGAGGLLTGSGLIIDPNSTYLVTVGAGGISSTYPNSGGKGSASVFNSITSTGGGGGEHGGTVDKNGGSGGGGFYGGAGGTGISGQGNNGGAGNNDGSNYPGGGGGGAGAVGSAASGGTAGNGGNGTASSISGSSVTYAGGGGGSGRNSGTSTGGTGGGGAGNGAGSGTAGTANLGGGGGGGGTSGSSGTGGSGVVIISYAGATQLMAGGTVTIVGGNVIHTFTSSGYLTPITLLTRSLRFRGAYPTAPSYLSRTAGTPTNNLKWTYSVWLKRGVLSVGQHLLNGGTGTSASEDYLHFLGSDKLSFYQGNATTTIIATNAVFRDPAAWYHIVLVYDSAQATSTNRLFIYVNGVSQSFSSATYPTLNQSTNINASGVLQRISSRTYAADEGFDGYMAEVNFIDGQALTPSSFGTINSYGVWQPITYGGSYGNNGFYLPFTNTTSTTTLGYDFSPQGNNWTTNNISLTAGSTYDSMTDVPTLTSATAANYCVMNPLVQRWSQPNTAYADGNLKVSTTSANSAYSLGTISQSTGKYYWEVTVVAIGTTAIGIGVGDSLVQNTTLTNTVQYLSSGSKTVGGSSTAYGASFTTNDVIGVALDLTGSSVTFYKNNTSQGSIGLPSTTDITAFQDINTPANLAVNFGQRPFTYTPPSGFVALNTYNL
jgi:hypothetical protein